MTQPTPCLNYTFLMKRSKAIFHESKLKSKVEEICEFGHDGTLLHIAALPLLIVDNVEVAPGLVCIPEKEIATDYFAIVIPLEEKLDKQIRRKSIDSSAIDGVGGKASIWQLYGIPVIAICPEVIPIPQIVDIG
jgi:hypothetical protein